LEIYGEEQEELQLTVCKCTEYMQTLLQVGTNSCNAFTLSVILTLRSCIQKTYDQKLVKNLYQYRNSYRNVEKKLSITNYLFCNLNMERFSKKPHEYSYTDSINRNIEQIEIKFIPSQQYCVDPWLAPVLLAPLAVCQAVVVQLKLLLDLDGY
jgi:hypothetical protein